MINWMINWMIKQGRHSDEPDWARAQDFESGALATNQGMTLRDLTQRATLGRNDGL